MTSPERLTPRLSRLTRVVSGPPRRLVAYLAGVLTAVSILGGVIANLLAPQDFAGFGQAIWWAIETFTTVGFGDVVPTSTEGQVVASLLMIGGITTISAFTAIVTAAFVSVQGRRLDLEHTRAEHDRDTAELAALTAIGDRLAAVEALLAAPPLRPGD
jgi:voltage-gated potassium channel